MGRNTVIFGARDLDGNKRRLIKKLMQSGVITSSGDTSLHDESLILLDDED